MKGLPFTHREICLIRPSCGTSARSGATIGSMSAPVRNRSSPAAAMSGAHCRNATAMVPTCGSVAYRTATFTTSSDDDGREAERPERAPAPRGRSSTRRAAERCRTTSAARPHRARRATRCRSPADPAGDRAPAARVRAPPRQLLMRSTSASNAAEMIGHRRGPQPMVERVLPERALRPIDRGEHVVQQQIAPGPVVERSAVVRCRDPGAVRRGHGVHAAGPLDRHVPRRREDARDVGRVRGRAPTATAESR